MTLSNETKDAIRKRLATDSEANHTLLDCLNPELSELIKERAKNMLSAPELIALPFLCAIASVIGDKQHAELIAGFRNPAILWGMGIVPSSGNKTGSEKEGTSFLDELQKSADREFEGKFALLPQAEQKKLNRKFFKMTNGQIQGLLARLSEGDGSLYRYCDEAIGFFKGFDQYSQGKGNEEQKYLDLWNGHTWNEQLVDSAKSYIIQRPRVSIMGMTQPDPIIQEMRKVTRDGDTAGNGMFGRWLMTMPDLPVQQFTDFDLFFRGSEKMTLWTDKAEQIARTLHNSKVRILWKLEEQTARWYMDYCNSNLRLAAKEGGFVGAYINKDRHHVGRLALVFAAIDLALEDSIDFGEQGSKQIRYIPLETLQRATRAFDYFVGEMRRIVSLMGLEGQEGVSDNAITPKLQAAVMKLYEPEEMVNTRELKKRAPLYNLIKTGRLTAEQADQAIFDLPCIQIRDGKPYRI